MLKVISNEKKNDEMNKKEKKKNHLTNLTRLTN